MRLSLRPLHRLPFPQPDTGPVEQRARDNHNTGDDHRRGGSGAEFAVSVHWPILPAQRMAIKPDWC